MRVLFSFAMSFLLFSSLAVSGDGLVSMKSPHSVKDTADHFEKALKMKGMTVFTRIDHAEGARKSGEQLRPTEVIIFGNPKIGTKLMQCSQSTGIDLPQKTLIWEDEDGQVWLSYNAPRYLAERHNINGCDEVLKKITNALGNFAKAATVQ